MKHFIIAAWLLLLGHASWSQFNVTFRVDMNNVTQTFTSPQISGTFNSWCGGCAPMSDADLDGIWELVIPLNAGSYEYKFNADSWVIQENLTPGAPCTVTNSGFTNRSLTVTGDVVLDAVCWGACVGCNVVVPNYDVTFRVDMNNVTQPFTLPNLNGSFNNWCGACAPMSDGDGDGIWEIVISLPAGSYEYKFSADGWNIQETLTPGSPCTITVGPFTNRTLNVTGDVVLDAVCWGSCVSCATVVPQHDVTFRVDMNNVAQSFTLPEVNGTFNNWCGGCAPMTDADGDGIWELTVTLDEGSYEYKFAADGWGIQESLTQGDPCTVTNNGFTNRSLNLTGDVVLDAVCWGSCTACPAETFDVTFRVDMNNVTVPFTTPEVNGSFNNWCGACAPMSDVDGDGIWELVIALPAGAYEYKFTADGFSIQENLNPSLPCTVTNFGFTNRSLNVTTDVVLDAVCYGACVGCNAVIPDYNITFRVNMNNVTAPYTTPEVNGTFNNWCGGCAPMSDANGDGIWELVVTLPAGNYEYKFAADGWAIQETLTEGDPCTINGAPFVNRSLSVTGNTVLDAVCWGSCNVGSLTLYADNDGDGFGAGAGTLFCTNPGAGYAALNTDCNDANAAIYPGATEVCTNSIDDDCDGLVNEGCPAVPGNDNRANSALRTAGAFPACGSVSGSLAGATSSPECFSSAPSGAGQDVWYRFTAQTNGSRIQATSATNDLVIELQTQAGTLVGIENANGVGGTEVLVANNLTPGAVYFVAVRNFNTLAAGSFNLCIQNLLPSGPDNGTTFSSLCGAFKCDWNGAQNYSVTFSDGANQFTASNGSTTHIPFSSFGGLQYGTSYQVVITSTFIQNDGTGANPETAVVVSPPFTINILPHATVSLRSSDRCPSTRPFFAYLSTDRLVCGATSWDWEFEEVDINNEPISLDGPVILNSATSSRFLKASLIPGIEPGKRYKVRIRPVFGGSAGEFGSEQYLCIAGAASFADGVENVASFERSSFESNSTAVVYPNPSNGAFINVRFNNLQNAQTTMRILDNIGRVVYQNTFSSEGSLNTSVVFDRKLSSGMYSMEIINGTERRVEKMIVE
ncbi:MAG: MopE-related protein [Flavobacteriales bacterium]|jgi:1,4-alpha-glucan branching enzyme